MDEKIELGKQQQKSKETKREDFSGGKAYITEKKDTKNYRLRTFAKKQVYRMEVFIIISKQKMICYLII